MSVQETTKTNKKKNYFKVSIWIFTTIIVLLLSVFITALWQQEKIVKKVLVDVNKLYTGNVSLDKFKLKPIKGFPNVTLEISDIVIYEDSLNSTEILNLEKIFIELDIKDLLNNKYSITEISIENGNISLVSDSSGITNLEKAFMMAQQEIIEEIDTSTTPVVFQLDELEIRNVNINFQDQLSNNNYSILLNELNTELSYENNQIKNDLELDITLKDIKDVALSSYFNSKKLEIESDIFYDMDLGDLYINQAEVYFEDGFYKVEGKMNTESFEGDLDFEGAVKQLSIVKEYLPHELDSIYNKHLVRGEVLVHASVKGNLLQQPLLISNINLNHIQLMDPDNQTNISEFSGFFKINSGVKPDYTDGEINLEEVIIQLNKSKVELNGKINNLLSPFLDLNLKTNLNLNELDAYYHLPELERYRGNIFTKLSLNNFPVTGELNDQLNNFKKNGYLILNLDKVNFPLPEFKLLVQDISTNINIYNGNLKVENGMFKTNHSDLNFDFKLANALNFVTEKNTDTQGEINLKSNTLDFKELLAYDKSLLEFYDSTISDLNFQFNFETQIKYLIGNYDVPYGIFNLENLSLKVDGYKRDFKQLKLLSHIKTDSIVIDELTAKIDESDITFVGAVNNYKAFINNDFSKPFSLNFDLISEYLAINDFAKYKGESMLPKEYQTETLNNFEFKSALEIDMSQNNNEIPDLKFKIDELHGKMSLHPLKFENFNVDIEVKEDDLYLHEFAGEIGESNFVLRAELEKPLDWINDSLSRNNEYVYFHSNKLNLNQLFDLGSEKFQEQLETVQTQTKEERIEKREAKEKPFEIYDIPFPELTLDVEIDTLIYQKAHIEELDIKLNSSKDYEMVLKNFRAKLADGYVTINKSKTMGEFTFSAKDPNNIFTKGQVKLSQLNVQDIFYIADNIGQGYLSDRNIEGIFAGNFFMDAKFNKEMSLDIEKSYFKTRFYWDKGRIKDAAFIMEYQSDLPGADLSDIKVKNQRISTEIINGQLQFTSKFNMSSTTGTIQLKDISQVNFNNNFNYNYYIVAEVPPRMLTYTIAIRGDKKREKTNDLENTSSKTKNPINITIQGDENDYKFNIGKKKKK